MWKTQSQERHWFHDVLNLYPPSMVHKASSEPRRQRAHNASDFDLSIVWVLLRFSRSCVYACGCAYMYMCVCVHVRLTGKGVAGRDWRQNTGNATMTMAAWIGRNGVYDNRKGIERGRNSISLSRFPTLSLWIFVVPSSSDPCVSSSTPLEHAVLKSLLSRLPVAR